MFLVLLVLLIVVCMLIGRTSGTPIETSLSYILSFLLLCVILVPAFAMQSREEIYKTEDLGKPLVVTQGVDGRYIAVMESLGVLTPEIILVETETVLKREYYRQVGWVDGFAFNRKSLVLYLNLKDVKPLFPTN